MVSAGCETIAQKIPARYPEAKVTLRINQKIVRELGSFAVLTSGSGEELFVEGCDDLLEGDEFHDGVGNLSGPERSETLVETLGSFV